MRKSDRDDTIFEAANEAIDEEDLARVLALAAGGDDVDDAAIAALREVAAHTIVADAIAAATAASWRGRPPTGDDVGTAAERRRSCCEDSAGEGLRPTSLKGVW